MPLQPIVLAVLLGAAAPVPVEQALTLLKDKKCEDAFSLAAQVLVPAAGTPEALQVARSLVQAAAPCAAADPAITLPFTTLAAKLAPKDAEVQLAQADVLLALTQRAEAAELLDRILAAGPSPRARFLRGKLAADEDEHALAVKTLIPLESDTTWGPKAKAIIEQSRAWLAAQEVAQKKLGENGKPLPVPTATASTKSQVSGVERGAVVATDGGSVSLHGSHTMEVKNLEVGRGYLFRANGTCKREKRMRSAYRTIVKEHESEVFGVDFRVTIGSQPSRPLSAGQRDRNDENKIPFVAEATSMTIRIVDESSVEGTGNSCTFSGFTVLAD